MKIDPEHPDVTRVRAAALELHDARVRAEAALADVHEAVRAAFPLIYPSPGRGRPTEFARVIGVAEDGAPLIGEGTVRALCREQRARQVADRARSNTTSTD